MAAPSHYSAELPRVSTVVGAFYSFENTPQERFFKDWLKKHSITRDEYMDEAQRVGTLVHGKIEKYIKTGKLPKRGRESKLVREAARFIDDLGLTELETEVYVRTKWYQGTCDLLAKSPDGQIVVADWKTWGAAKWKWKLNYDYRRNQGKIDKVRMQMSLYAMPLAATKCYGVELRDDGYHSYASEPYKPDFLINLLDQYEASLRKDK